LQDVEREGDDTSLKWAAGEVAIHHFGYTRKILNSLDMLSVEGVVHMAEMEVSEELASKGNNEQC